MKKPKFIKTIEDFTVEISEDNINAHSAASAFYMFMSLVPFVTLLTSIIPLTGLSQDVLFEAIDRYLPSALQSLIASFVDEIYIAPGAVLPISIITTIWLSSRAFSALIRGIEDIFHAKKYSSFFKRSLLACFYTIGMIIVAVVVLAFMVFGQEIFDFMREHMPRISPALQLLLKFRFVVAFIVLTFVFHAIYRFAPSVKLNFLNLLPGAAGAAGGWLLFTWFFSLYIQLARGFSTYGSLATIIISLLWMYWCMYIILLGAAVNEFIQELRSKGEDC